MCQTIAQVWFRLKLAFNTNHICTCIIAPFYVRLMRHIHSVNFSKLSRHANWCCPLCRHHLHIYFLFLRKRKRKETFLCQQKNEFMKKSSLKQAGCYIDVGAVAMCTYKQSFIEILLLTVLTFCTHVLLSF